MTFGLLLTAALALPGADPGAPSGAAPTQVLASIDAKGNLKITYVTNACSGWGPGMGDMNVPVEAEKGKPPAQIKVRVTRLMVTMAELDAKHVKAYTTDGRTVSAKQLAEQLAKERPVLVSTDGKKVDPYYLELYKDGTLVLVPPANTLNLGSDPFGGFGGYGPAPVYMPMPAPPPGGAGEKLRPVEKKEEKER